ncbi:argininosuccinate lyase [Paenalcaligenes niemegkensis]|uniref:argininosuccinate lyase n=1 Tax=Paenalcaligenes niemegkensis TaxID=2895469 RepID=UPI001EE952E9|nr:argininosuccinate lyase [Paenalcaligenes niemegkensis]MCQ9615601.1 argininosuccinate lyase [Paenalcaligenes niemegkensis]
MTHPTLIRMAVVAALLSPMAALTAAPSKQGCKTTAECNALAAKIGTSAGIPSGPPTSENDRQEDQFYWLNKINKASIVMLQEEGIITKDTALTLAKGVDHTIRQADAEGGKRPSDVLQIEGIISEAIGPDASLVHTGRSRQDMYATFRMAQLRNQMLDYFEVLTVLRANLQQLASEHVDTVMPAYTNGVQAMPISLAHYLLAYDASFERDAQRMAGLYTRMNLSAMGTAVLANSSWPLNRERLAELLGFDGVIENSLDAGQVSPSDVSLEAMAILNSGAIRLGAFMNDVHTQYHQTRPWMLLDESATYSSSAMPQKRNPGLIMRAREAASNVVGLTHTVTIRAHNVSTGMTDYKNPWAELGVVAHAVNMIRNTNRVLVALKVDPERSLEELEDDWTTSMELAEVLQKDHAIPFRVGHSFASLVVSRARADGLRPRDFSYNVAAELYKKALANYDLPVSDLPISEQRFRDVLSARKMVETRLGTGGPQPAEVERMLKKSQNELAQSQAWLEERREGLANADKMLSDAFDRLLP